jgi:glycosyltransferase involved in cell wall biosynthesis
MNILILNWRDPKNPTSGGAELLTQELAKRWVEKGHTVNQISSSFRNAKKKEIIDGVHFIRWGQWWNVHLYAFYYYLRYVKNSTDIIIDEVHWFPFFSALYARKKTVLLVCEVANNLFYQIFPYPIAAAWRIIEKLYLIFYKNVPAMAISKSTYNDLIKEGHSPVNLIILPMGLSAPIDIKHYPKEKHPTLITISRLNKQKGIFDLVESFILIKKKIPDAVMWFVGSGTEEIIKKITDRFEKANIANSVTFWGFIQDEKKFELLSRAHILVSASAQEGWGLTVPEAGLTRTPSVVYNTHGFRDIIENKKDGILVNTNPSALATEVIDLLQNSKLYSELQSSAEKKARQYSWDKSAGTAIDFFTNL